MRAWHGWARGRQLSLTGGVWLLTSAVVYAWWWVNVDGPWAPFSDPYPTQIVRLVPILGASIAVYGILPRLDWVDLQAVTRPQNRDVIAAALLALGFSAIPLLIRWSFTLSEAYLLFIPAEGREDLQQLDVAAPFPLFWVVSSEICLISGATFLMVGLLGRVFGPLAGPVCYLAMLIVQGYRLAPLLLPRIDWHGPGVSTATGPAVAILGLAVFRLSRSGTRPLNWQGLVGARGRAVGVGPAGRR